ncbi:MAG: enoyl-CoA hydratase/isomerase family protein [Myxococcota bacterium]
MPADLLLRETVDGVTTLTMNNPRRLNGWTMDMIDALATALEETGRDDATKVLILTGAGEYYCAGVNLGASIQFDHPANLHAFIVERNQALFDMFLNFPKPILIAVNGPAIGASVTSATLCNAVLASDRATFSTPFAALGVPPEGCSSEVFPKLLGDDAPRMLGQEGWKPTGEEAAKIGLATRCVPHDDLMTEANALARQWIADGETRRYPLGMSREDLLGINARESRVLATAFLQPKFLMGQYRFLWSKKKRPLALMFLLLAKSQPAWKLLLPTEAR